MYAGLLDKRNFVCNVLKLVSSLAFCSTRGGLCLRLYVRYSSSLFCTPDKELSACRLCSHGNVRLIHSRSYNKNHTMSIMSYNGGLLKLIFTSLAKRSYSSIKRSFSWFTFNTLQIRLAAVSAYIHFNSNNYNS